MTRADWFRLVLGVFLGLIFGLYYAWFVSPRQIHQSSPNDLSSEYQNEYLTLIASAYASSGNLSDAISRLAQLDTNQTSDKLEGLAQEHLAAGRPEVEVRALAQLASAIANDTETVLPPPTATTDATTIPPSPTASASAPPPSPVPTTTPLPSFRLQSIEKVCDRDLVDPLIQVIVENENGEGVPGVEILIIWDQGEDHFFTGMKPELGLGYGDFYMDLGITYSLQLADTLETVTNIQSEECATQEGGVFPGSVFLQFKEP